MKLTSRLIDLRKNIRNNQRVIVDKLKTNHNLNLCVFCGIENNLTKEHILPQWVYDRNPKRIFTTNTNGISQTYNKSVLPCCSSCNNEILGHLEYVIQDKLKDVDLELNCFEYKDIELIILWLETITYKLQVMDIRRKFKKDKNSEFIPYLSDFPISFLQDLSLSPSKVFSNLRKSLKKISIKSKTNRINSLLVFKTKNPDFHFIHSSNNFIFLELPKYEIALFYFLNKEFRTHKDAHDKCINILDKEY
ncbi:hypothetical protein A9Q91_05070 [Candidatus Gracilibacteria bacterium 28_42_T64]|nr:hypothetical protein A9Q91_05070 [Candidatus Gracilibacteria bacterium 28_42_T64]